MINELNEFYKNISDDYPILNLVFVVVVSVVTAMGITEVVDLNNLLPILINAVIIASIVALVLISLIFFGFVSIVTIKWGVEKFNVKPTLMVKSSQIIKNSKQIDYVIKLAQNELDNSITKTINSIMSLFGIIAASLITITFVVLERQSELSLETLLSIAGYVILLYLLLLGLNFLFNKVFGRNDALHKIVQTGVELKYLIELNVKIPANKFEEYSNLVKNEFDGHKFIHPSLTNKFESIFVIKK